LDTYSLSLHDALPILSRAAPGGERSISIVAESASVVAQLHRGLGVAPHPLQIPGIAGRLIHHDQRRHPPARFPRQLSLLVGGERSEEHTSELQSRENL